MLALLYRFNIVIFVFGLSAIIAQAVMLREFLVSFSGNELTLGVILANWVLSGALGAFFVGRFIDRLKHKINFFCFLQIIFSLSLFPAVYLTRALKNILGLPFGETIGLASIFFSSFLILLPLNFCLGGIFSSACAILGPGLKDKFSIGKLYGWEAAGFLVGGIIFTYCLIPYFNAYEIIFFIFILNILLYCILFKLLSTKIFKFCSLTVVIFSLLFFSFNLGYINNRSIQKQWQGKPVLDVRNSIYGNIAVTKEAQQYSFFYNGVPVITAPYPDISFVEEFGNLPLAFHPAPKKILIIGAGAGGLINEFLKHPLEEVDYAELDPLIISLLKKYPTELTKRELSEKRVKIANVDGRLFLKNTNNLYDVILLGISKPADLTTNRLFSEEFYYLAKSRLNKDGILAFWLPGSLTYTSKESRDFFACILNAARSAFSYIRVIPGDYHIILASGSGDIMNISGKEIFTRLANRTVNSRILSQSHLDYRFNQKYVDWFWKSMSNATKRVNHDFRPMAVFLAAILWNKQFSPGATGGLQLLGNLNLTIIFIVILLLTVLLYNLFSRKPAKRLKQALVASMFTTGFFGMFTSLILIFSFQVIYGYLYYKMGLLIGIFMAGIALGSIFMAGAINRQRVNLKLFVFLEILVIIFSLFLALIILGINRLAPRADLIFLGLCFIPGLFLGLEFPLACKLYFHQGSRIGRTSGLIYGADLAGGWLAGLFTGIVFLPVLGLFGSCMVVVMLKISSLTLLVWGQRPN